jgi:putative phosphoesterase
VISTIGLIADTHDNLDCIKIAVGLFNERGVDLVVHAGDMISPFTVPYFKELDCPFIGVFGNNDGERRILNVKFKEMGVSLDDFCEYTFEGLDIAVYHGTYGPVLSSLVKSGNYHLVVAGHTHTPEVIRDGRTLMVNPGEACGYLSGKRTVAILDQESMEAEIVELD